MAAEQINTDLENIHNWANKWLVSFSLPKTKSMTISLKTNKPLHPPLFLSDQVINSVESHKHLGLTLAHDLTWNQHIKEITKTAGKRIDMLKPLKMVIDRKTLERLYLAYIRPTMEYASVVWDSPKEGNHIYDSLERMQQSAARLVCRATARCNVEKLYEEVCWCSLKERRQNQRLCLFYKILNNMAPRYLSLLMPQQVEARTHYPLRNRGNIDVPFSRLDSYKFSFFPCTIRAWNELPPGIKEAPSLDAFKAHMKSDMVSRRAHNFSTSQ